jgi:hypothetical protein
MGAWQMRNPSFAGTLNFGFSKSQTLNRTPQNCERLIKFQWTCRLRNIPDGSNNVLFIQESACWDHKKTKLYLGVKNPKNLKMSAPKPTSEWTRCRVTTFGLRQVDEKFRTNTYGRNRSCYKENGDISSHFWSKVHPSNTALVRPCNNRNANYYSP